MTSQFNCPACGKALRITCNRRFAQRYVIYCPHGPCEDMPGGKAANMGAVGKTEQECFDRLKQEVEEEKERQ